MKRSTKRQSSCNTADSPFREDFERVAGDKEDAIMFLASIIPRRNRVRIRAEIKNDKDFEVKQHFFLGMSVRNALRAGDFFYLPETLDFIWFSMLEEAVNLPKDKIILTDSIRERIRKYRARKRRAPLCPPLKLEEIGNAKRQLERKHNIKLPEVDVRYCDNIAHALCFLSGERARAKVPVKRLLCRGRTRGHHRFKAQVRGNNSA